MLHAHTCNRRTDKTNGMQRSMAWRGPAAPGQHFRLRMIAIWLMPSFSATVANTTNCRGVKTEPTKRPKTASATRLARCNK